MLKDKAQPIVVDELLGRIDEVDESGKSIANIIADAVMYSKDRSWRHMGRRDCAGREIDRVRLFTLCDQKFTPM